MAAADELYLLFQQCSDLQKEKIADWEKHFSWLEEVVSLSNEARGQSVLPKTPMTTRKTKKTRVELNEKKEKEEPFDAFSVPSLAGLRKSSRAAARTATMKIGRNLEDISNIGSKLRRPSSPKKVTFTPQTEQLEMCQSSIIENAIDSRRCSNSLKSAPESSSSNEGELTSQRESNAQSCRSDSGIGSEKIEIDLECDYVKRQSLEKLKMEEKAAVQEPAFVTEIIQDKLNNDKMEMPPPNLICPAEVTDNYENSVRTDLVEEEKERPVRSTRTKKKSVEEKAVVQQAAIMSEKTVENEFDHAKIMMPPPNLIGLLEDIPNDITDINKNTEKPDQLEVENERPVRSTRTKKRQVEEKEFEEQQPVRVTRTKKRKMEEDMEKPAINLSNKPIVIITDCDSESHQVTETSKRVTRSKIKQIIQINSPVNVAQSNVSTPKQNKYGLSSPRSGNKIKSVSRPNTLTNSPLLTSFPNNRKHVPNSRIVEVEEVSDTDVTLGLSPMKIFKHGAIFDKHSNNVKISSSSQKYQTPTQASIYKARIHAVHSSKNNHLHSNTSVLSSGSLHSVLSQKRTFISSSSPNISSSRIIGTPTEVNRTKNLLSGISSFITKVQPPKQSKEDSEERKLEELRRKNERVEESQRKKDEILKQKVEEQKRKNEERMRRAQETREARDKKALETRLLQEQERKLKEQRMKEEKKKQISAKKREELAKLQRLKEQEEQQKQIEEQRRIEERHKEELRRAEEKQKEDQKKAELKHREEQKRANEKIKEDQRIAEEKYKEECRKAEEELQLAVEQQREELRRAEEKQQQELKRADEKRQKLEMQRKLLEQKREKEQRAKEEYERQKMKEKERIERERRELQILKEKEEAAKKENPNSTFVMESKEHQANTTYTRPSETSNADSYEMTPVAKKLSKKKSTNPDDYDIREICSEDSTDEEGAPKKQIPLWAKGDLLRKTLFSQEYYPPNIDGIFPPHDLLTMPDLSIIFTVKSREQKIKYSKRTSSAVWDTPPYKLGGQG